MSPICARLRRVPSTENFLNFSAASPSTRAECRTLLMMIGRIAFSSKFPWLPANATALSSPITWIHTMTNHDYRFALRWIDLAGHDRRARLIFGQEELTETTA